MIEILGLEKRFGGLRVLTGLDLHVETGRITVVVGANASGKTTVIKVILGLVRPDRGTVFLNGHSLLVQWQLREKIGYMQQYARLPINLSATEIFRFLADLRGEPPSRLEELVDLFRLRTEVDKPIRALSGGTRQKVNAVISLMFAPEILILDEPTAGLDPISSRLLKDRIRVERDRGTTVLLTSHLVNEIEELADTIVLLGDGRVKFAGSPPELHARTGERSIEAAFARMLAEETGS